LYNEYTVVCPEVISHTVKTVFIDKHCCSSVIMLRLDHRLEVFPHLYALLTVSLVLVLSSRLTCSQDIWTLYSRFTVRSSDILTVPSRSFAGYFT